MKYKHYKIKEGKHDYFNLPKLTCANSLNAMVMFPESWRYNLKNKNQKDINKVLGLSDSWSYHKKHSARFGARYNTKLQKIELFAYTYREGKVYAKFLKYIRIKHEVFLGLKIEPSHYAFYVNNVLEQRLPRTCELSSKGLKYILLPYFGGDEPAPHDITTLIKWL